ncbi:MAG: NUDIX domain-containing protein [Pseudomonadota bacterium]
MVEKVCPLVIRSRAAAFEVLAFRHPQAGCQLVKGTIRAGEAPDAAAARELREESGLSVVAPPLPWGTPPIGLERTLWHVFLCEVPPTPDRWTHFCKDDGGHWFEFFWHPLYAGLDARWAAPFHGIWDFAAPRIGALRSGAAGHDALGHDALGFHAPEFRAPGFDAPGRATLRRR